MNTLLWKLRQAGRALGRSGLLGLALLVIAGLLQAVDIAPANARIAANAARISVLEAEGRARTEAAAQSERKLASNGLPAAQAPTITVAGEQVRELENIARKHGVALLRGQYTPTAISGTALVRWQIVLPISAPYPNVRSFVADSLAAIPTLALEDIRLKRETIAETTVEADLRFNLYLREVAQ